MGVNFSKYPNVQRGHQYALDVVDGKIVACKYVIGACERYLRDVEDKTKDWYFDPAISERYLKNVQNFDHVIGKWKTKKIVYEPWQCWVWMCIQGFRMRESGFRRFRIAHVEIARGNSKALSLDTEVPTPDRGLVLYGSLKIGDRVYGSNGKPCKITGMNKVHVCESYKIEFSDGSFVKCSDKHLWVTSTKNERRNGKKSVKTTKEIFKTQKILGESNHSIDVCSPVEGAEGVCHLPYVLGYWLGNGHSSHGKFTCHANHFEDVAQRFKSRKLELRVTSTKGNSVTFIVPSLTYWLRELGVIKNKHIPEKYFTADEDTRRELLRGLMDSDGSLSKEICNFTFCNVNEKLARGTRRLVASLGYKATIRKTRTSCQNGFAGKAFYVTFSTPHTRPKVFGIKAKEFNRPKRTSRYCNKRYIVGVNKIKDLPMFCIEVDSPDKTFLITDQYIPTHNSSMASQMALSELALDNPNGNQISTVATKKDQARIVLDAARAMAKKNSSYLKHTGVKVLAHAVVHPESNSVLRALASDTSGLDGLNDILAVCDELHAMKRETFDVIYSGMSKRADSLTLCITTAGTDVDSVGYSQSVYAKKVCLGDVSDDQFFAVVYCLDEADDWADEKVWLKANPNLGVSVDVTTLKAKVEKAIVTPADIPNIKIKHMNLWIAEAKAFYDQKVWDKCADPSIKLEDFKGHVARMGIDLASHVDITAMSLVFRKDGVYYIFDRSYIPEDTIKEAKNVLYDDCVSRGYLISTKGAAINYDYIKQEAEDFSKMFRVHECLYDAWNATEMAQKLSDKIDMVKIGMNVANFSEPMKKLDSLMREGKIRHNGSPLLRWCLGNVVAKEDHNGNVYPRKSHVRLKIDPIIAVLMALAGWLQDTEKESIYESRGIRVL